MEARKTKPKSYTSTYREWGRGSPTLSSRIPGESVTVLSLGQPRITCRRKTRKEPPTPSSLFAPSPEEVDILNEDFLTPSEGPALKATAAPLPDDVNKTSTEPKALHEPRAAEHVTGHNKAPNAEHVGAHPHSPAANAGLSVIPPHTPDQLARPPLSCRAGRTSTAARTPLAPSTPIPTAHVSPAKTARVDGAPMWVRENSHRQEG